MAEIDAKSSSLSPRRTAVEAAAAGFALSASPRRAAPRALARSIRIKIVCIPIHSRLSLVREIYEASDRPAINHRARIRARSPIPKSTTRSSGGIPPRTDARRCIDLWAGPALSHLELARPFFRAPRRRRPRWEIPRLRARSQL